jgi:hypothetical protein
MALILVDVHSVTYLKQDKPRPVVLFEVMKGMVTGKTPDLGEPRTLDERELREGERTVGRKGDRARGS